MRRLIRCPSCNRQYDATARAAGDFVRCRCGSRVPVGGDPPRDAAVVRCASCGAPREGAAPACRYCGSDFTIHEQDLLTICPACLARISSKARYCHHCATAIAPEEIGGEETERHCPACGDGKRLRSRALGAEGISVLECVRCAGLWLSTEAFQALRDRTLQATDPSPDPATVRAETRRRANPTPAKGRMYRKCPVCAELMTRINYAKRSGILLDRCALHGIWFDAQELEAALRWIRIGGERLARERDLREERERESLRRFRVEPKDPNDPRADTNAWGEERHNVVPWILGKLFG
ncbi:MAG TPA: zf-TFIIB domain-containing protein [Candidatus Polarisedimenticolaceae bacterium]